MSKTKPLKVWHAWNSKNIYKTRTQLSQIRRQHTSIYPLFLHHGCLPGEKTVLCVWVQGFGCGAGTPRHLEGIYKQKTLNYPAVRNIVLGFYKVFSGLINAHNTEVV